MRRIQALMLFVTAMLSASCGDGTTVVRTQECTVRIRCYSPSIVKVEKFVPGTTPSDSSLCVILQPGKTRMKVSRTGSEVYVRTDSLSVRIDRKDGSVSFSDGARALVSEKPGTSVLEPRKDGPYDAFRIAQTFILDDGEAIYGLGQHRYGSLNWRGQKVDLWQRNMDISIPVVHSSRGYAIYWDNTGSSVFEDGAEGMSLSSDAADGIDYYFIYGGDADGVIRGLHELSGTAPMNALWSYGFIQSKNAYWSWEEMAGVVKKYRSLNVPLDGIVLDYSYPARHGDLAFTRDSFSNPKAGIDSLHALNAHCIISIWPSFLKGTPYFDSFAREGLLIPTEAMPDSTILCYDASSPKARDIYWNHIAEGLYPAGVDGWWMDATEPEFRSYYKPSEADCDICLHGGTFRRIQLAYPMLTSAGVYEHQRAVSDDKRVFILTRSGAFGQQRYAAQCWSGDTDGVMEELRRQIPAALNYGMSGLSYWTSDIGGYFCDYEGGNRNPDYRKVYARWFQFGTFSSIMRSHGMHTPREIYQWGQQGDVWYDNQEKFINLRYRLLPYTYSLARKVTEGGDVFMRPLFMDWPEDGRVLDLEDEFLYGRSILVAPVTNLESVREVYLPDGNWTDFWSGEKIAGRTSFTKEYAIDDMPVFVREGSIIPFGPDVQYASGKDWGSLQIRIYDGADADFELYEDEGDNYNYEDGAFSVIPFHWDDASRTLTIGNRSGSFAGMLEDREFRIVVVRRGKACGLDNSSTDLTVHYDGNSIKTGTLN